MDSNELAVVANEKETGILDFTQIHRNSNANVETFSNIKDKKKLFNLESHVDVMLNDCVGEMVRVKEVLIRKYYKPLENPVVDDETGEVLKDTEVKASCVLIDDSGKSYATGSKTFIFNMLKLLGDYEGYTMLDEGIEIRIIKVPVPNSSNKALSFELV